MNVPILHIAPSPNPIDEAIDRLTLEFVRAFRDLDFELELWLSEAGNGGPKRSSGQRLGAISDSVDALVASKSQKKRLAGLEIELGSALIARNALVHGRVTTVHGANGCVILATMLEHEFSNEPLCYRLCGDALEQELKKVSKVTSELIRWRKQRPLAPSNSATSDRP